MQYGLSLPNGGPWGDARTLAKLSQLAEDSGWDGVFLEDYIVWQSDQSVPTYDPWVALAAIAMQTERIRIGTQVTALARRRPWKVARRRSPSIICRTDASSWEWAWGIPASLLHLI